MREDREPANHDALPFGVNGHVSDEIPPAPALEPAAPESEEVLYVNPKQYLRILSRRRTRARLDEIHRLSKQRKPYLHESRHKHAMRRPRGPGGRFLTAQEIAEQNAKQAGASSPSEHADSPETPPPITRTKTPSYKPNKGKAKAEAAPSVAWSDVGPTEVNHYPAYDPSKDSLDMFYTRPYPQETQSSDPMLSMAAYQSLPLPLASYDSGPPSAPSEGYYHPHMASPGPPHSHQQHPELAFQDPLAYPSSPEDILNRYGGSLA